jgi:hypothetical protein
MVFLSSAVKSGTSKPERIEQWLKHVTIIILMPEVIIGASKLIYDLA